MFEIPFHDAGIRPQTTELKPSGKHDFLGEPPAYLHELLEYSYMAMAMFQVNRPTGGSSWNLLVRWWCYKRLAKQLPQLLEATRWLERMITAWKKTSAQSAPVLIAQAEDLLWYLRKEPADPKLSAIFDAVRAIPETSEAEQQLLDRGVDLLRYMDTLRMRSLRRISKAERFVVEVRGANAYFLMEIIARRLDIPSDDLLDKARLIVSDLVLPAPGDCFG